MRLTDMQVEQLQWDAEAHKKNVDKFAEELKGDNPQYAMEWGESAFTAAAKWHVAQCLLELHAQGRTIAEMREYAIRETRYLECSSTSAVNNTAKLKKHEAWLDALYGTFAVLRDKRTLHTVDIGAIVEQVRAGEPVDDDALLEAVIEAVGDDYADIHNAVMEKLR